MFITRNLKLKKNEALGIVLLDLTTYEMYNGEFIGFVNEIKTEDPSCDILSGCVVFTGLPTSSGFGIWKDVFR